MSRKKNISNALQTIEGIIVSREGLPPKPLYDQAMEVYYWARAELYEPPPFKRYEETDTETIKFDFGAAVEYLSQEYFG